MCPVKSVTHVPGCTGQGGCGESHAGFNAGSPNMSSQLRQLLHLRLNCLPGSEPDACDHDLFRCIGLESTKSTKLHQPLDFARFEYRGLSPLLLWEDPLLPFPSDIDSLKYTMSRHSQPWLKMPPQRRIWRGEDYEYNDEDDNTAGDQEEDLDMLDFGMDDRVCALEQRLDAGDIDLSEYESELFELKCAIQAEGRSGDIEMIGIENAIGDMLADDHPAPAELGDELASPDLSWVRRSAMQEAERVAGIYNLRFFKDEGEDWVKSLATALQTEWTFALTANPEDWSPAAIAHAKCLEQLMCKTWKDAVRKLVPPIIASQTHRRDDFSWKPRPSMGDAITMLVLGQCMLADNSSPRQTWPVASRQAEAAEWQLDYSMNDRIAYWDRTWRRINEHQHRIDRHFLDAAHHMAELVDKKAKQVGWRGIDELILILDAYRHVFRNGPAHETRLTRLQAQTSRRLLVGSFQAYLWSEVPLFNQHRSILGAFRPDRERTHCDRNLAIDREFIGNIQHRFRLMFDDLKHWRSHPEVADLFPHVIDWPHDIGRWPDDLPL
jgi:hypothetical protein